jgi:hypothetical protein
MLVHITSRFTGRTCCGLRGERLNQMAYRTFRRNNPPERFRVRQPGMCANCARVVEADLYREGLLPLPATVELAK